MSSVCSACGFPLEDGAGFCTNCGSQVVDDIFIPSGNQCLSCGAALEPDATFCTQCGTPVGGDVSPYPAHDIFVDPPIAMPGGEPICTGCGNPMEPGSSFCVFCGKQVEDGIAGEAECVCKFCGAVIEPDSSFCTQCGNSLESVSEESFKPKKIDFPVYSEDPIPTPPVPPTPSGKRCPACGEMNDLDSAFCVSCCHVFSDSDRCPNCNSILDPITKTCSACGYSAAGAVNIDVIPSPSLDTEERGSLVVNMGTPRRQLTEAERLAAQNFHQASLDSFDE